MSSFGITRTGGTALDAAAVQQRSRAFGAAVQRLKGGATLLALRDEYGMKTMMLTPDVSRTAKSAADQLANSVQGKADEVAAPDLSCESIGFLTARPSSAAARETTAGADPAEVARTIERSTLPGSWVAVTLRAPSRGEIKRTRRWFDFRSVPGTHYSREGEAMIASFYAGGPDAASVQSLLGSVMSVLPGFDVEFDVRTLSSSGAIFGTGFGAAALWGLLVPGHELVDPVLADLPNKLGPMVSTAGLGLAGVLGAATLGIASGVIPTNASRTRNAIAAGNLPAPAGGPGVGKRPPRKEGKKPDGTIIPEFGGDYPLANTSFLVGPSVVVGVAAPYGGGSAGAAVTQERTAPPVLLSRIGPAIGTSPAAKLPVHISAADFSASIMILGIPDAGKSVALRAIFGWHCLERVAPKGVPGYPGKKSALIAFENKGEGAAMYERWARGLGDDPVRIDIADARTAAIDFFDVPGTTREKSLLFVNAMRYAFPEGSIEAQSMETLTAIMDAAQHVDDEVVERAGVPRGSVVTYAHILLGGNGDEAGVDLAVALAQKANKFPDDEDLQEAVLRLRPMYGGKQNQVTPANRRQLQSAPRNKMDALVEAKSWWSADRPRVGWKTLLQDFECVILNTGVSDDGSMVSDRLTQLMSSMLMFTLREAVMRYCSGWKDQGKSVSIFADELALLSGGSSDVITWFRNQGRSYGVRQILATQFPDQLNKEVQTSVLGFGTVYWFTQTNVAVAQMAVDDLTADGSEWTRADITGLAKHHAIVRATVDKQRQPGTTVRIGYWEGEGGLPVFCADQGYSDTTSLEHPPSVRGWQGQRPAPQRAIKKMREVLAVDDDTTDAESDVETPVPFSDEFNDLSEDAAEHTGSVRAGSDDDPVAGEVDGDDFEDATPVRKPAPAKRPAQRQSQRAAEPKKDAKVAFDPRRFDMGGDDFGPPPEWMRKGDDFGNPPRRK